MQTSLVLLVGLLISCNAALASDTPVIEAGINKMSYQTALVHTDRAKRSAKFLWLVPGKVTRYHYEWVLADGRTVTKIEETKAPGVPDRRPLRDSHPNLAVVVPAAQAFGTFAGPAIFHK